ncbi:MAG: 23S rRNA (guanosine(2251)-2'-O)-methyltransferase RlmB [Gammaproteobacteria bacterium]|nr:23S rRNA (guanosine(2251)-2'-O)-methyltransferase RlmB [Gammaproteobacteria bacterium]
MRDPVRVVRLFVIRARDDVRVSALLEAAAKVACPVDRIEAVRLERMVGAVVHQGVVAEVRPLAPWNEDQLANALANPLPSAGPPLLLVLDGVQDPHNLGACLRTADACGALAVITPKDRAVQLNATVRKVAAGAADTTPVVAVTNLARCLRDLKDAGLWIIGAEASAAKRADQVDLKGPTALVLGAEGSGLRQLTRQHCDLLVTLPALGAVESLNVSVAAGMLLYEALRQRYS